MDGDFQKRFDRLLAGLKGFRDNNLLELKVLGIILSLFFAVLLFVAIIGMNLQFQDNPLVLGVSIGLFLILLKYTMFSLVRTKLTSELDLEAILVIVLTLVFIQVSYPFFSPRVDILSSQIIQGYVDNTGEYVYEVFSATVKKPMLMACGSFCGQYCTDMSFFRSMKDIVNAPEVRVVKKGDQTSVCTYGNFDMTTRVLDFNAEYPHPMSYTMGDLNLTLVTEYNVSNGEYIYSRESMNNMPFPVTFRDKTFVFRINDDSMIPTQWDPATGVVVNSASLYDTILANSDRNCPDQNLSIIISNSFRVSDTKYGGSNKVGGYPTEVKVDKKARMIDVSIGVYGTLSPSMAIPYFIIYKPGRCLK